MAKKTQLGYQEIESRLRFFKDHSVATEDIGYLLLYCFGKSEAEIKRWREGKSVLKTFDGLLIKGLICYQQSTALQLSNQLERLKENLQVIKATPKIIVVSDGKTLLAYDMREHETYENPLQNVYCDFTFFYPLMDVEKVRNVEESPADVKAAEKLAKLHDEIRAFNEFTSDTDLHDLNIFITRLLFCFFAEDTGIFSENLFTNSIKQYTLDDGTDLSRYLEQSFEIMDIPERERKATVNTIVGHFPYVNGGLFSHHIQIPKLSARARRIILECGELNWQDINPDIFGSMIQAVVNPDERATQGMHYTSVPNIMKVIQPLFLDELRKEYESLAGFIKQKKQMLDIGMITSKVFIKECKPYEQQCRKLLKRMSKMKFFDPACGSGNFLIITYKALRFLEMDILRLIQDCNTQGMLEFIDGSVISINQFYGIELLDLPHEVAMLSLWLAEHQMNKKLHDSFGVNTRALPLQNITQIVCGNACRLDWNVVCKHEKEEEVFVFGNPPYLGSRRQDENQKKDLELIYKKDFGELDYIACWFLEGAKYIKNSKAKYAFVSTNSICQGLQVSLIWPKVFAQGTDIEFAYKSFKWSNNAKNKAAVTVIVVGVACKEQIKKKTIFEENQYRIVSNISPLLMDGPTIFVANANKPLCEVPLMNFGNMPADGGMLILATEEKEALIAKDSRIEKYIKPLIGAEEFINGKSRWCIWLYNEKEEEYLQINEIKKRIDQLKIIREKSSRPQLAAIPHLFAQITQPMNCSFIIIPRVSSENRNYIPIGYLEKGNIAADSCMVVGTDRISLFGILTSRIHMDWVRTVGGRLKTDYRYSAGLCYNTFPFPKIPESKKKIIESAAEEVLLTRENYPGKTLADLYDPDLMPADLKAAHEKLDDIVESCYPGYPFASDEARLECLFKMYEKMTKK